MSLPDYTTPETLAKHLGWSARRVRNKARELGACRVLGNRMVLLPEDVDAIMEATCPSKSIAVREVLSGNIGERLPDVDSVALLAHLTKKPRKSSQIEALIAVERAARSYFNNYLQDEAAELECCHDELQHERAMVLQAALALVGQENADG